MAFRSQFRDKQEWLSSTGGNIDLNTQSDEAAKMYDAALTQLCGWYEDQTLGGLDGCIKRMLQADPDFVLGQALAIEVKLMGCLTTPRIDTELNKRIQDFNLLLVNRTGSLTQHEVLHAHVINLWGRGALKDSTRTLEELATRYPQDLSAIKMTQDAYFFLGQALPMRSSVANCLSKIEAVKAHNPLRGYAYGMYAFALEESNMYPQAQIQAVKAIAMNPRDTWAIHSYAHCLEMQAKAEEGLKWMLDKKCDWEPCGGLACHQYWHTALFHINNNNLDEAVGLLDDQILTRCMSGCSTIDLHDAASMIYRMELVDLFSKAKCNKYDRWSAVYDTCKPHVKDHLVGFNDAHFMMSYLGANDLKLARLLVDHIDMVPTMEEGKQVVRPLLEAMYQFKLKNYGQCVDLLEPIRYDIVRIGGSHAQRDVFEQLLVVAALKSDKTYHNKLAERLISERKFYHGYQTIQTKLLAQSA